MQAKRDSTFIGGIFPALVPVVDAEITEAVFVVGNGRRHT